MFDLENQIRKIAKSNKYQNLYNATEKCSGINIFENKSNFSALQLRFLYWLSTYNMLYTELATYEDGLLSEGVIDDDIRTDAYLVYRNKKNEYQWKKYRQEEKEAQMKNNRKKGFKNPGKESLISVDLRREEQNG